LEQLEQKLSALTPPSDVASPQPPVEVHETQLEHNVPEHVQPHAPDEMGWDLFAANAMAGLTPGELLDLAEQLDVDSFLYQPEL
jgi:hypothetical protein